MIKKLLDILKKNLKKHSCKDCLYYNCGTGVCLSKKVCNNGYGKITLTDVLFCEPYMEDKEE